MRIEIKPSEASSEQYFVNGKLVWQNMSGNWICKQEMEPLEKQFFEEYLETVRKIRRGITAIYSI